MSLAHAAKLATAAAPEGARGHRENYIELGAHEGEGGGDKNG